MFLPRVSGNTGLFTLSSQDEIGSGWTVGVEACGIIASQEQSAADTIILGWKF
ncbi:hypothetical protein [Novosphingopyxis sp.]|uniref:hypothetical protein n=1 Tax=Novosphingopyxis sp. TaxID=2709690 RepID=UPI003B5AC68D